MGLSVLDPLAVQMTRIELDGRQRIVYDVQLITGRVRLASTEVLHIKAGLPIPGALRGVSPTVAARETIGTGLAARQFGANFFGTGATLSGVIEIARPDERRAGRAPAGSLQEEARRRQQEPRRRHPHRRRPVEADVRDPDESQHLETQKYTDATIAALFGVPAEYVVAGRHRGRQGLRDRPLPAADAVVSDRPLPAHHAQRDAPSRRCCRGPPTSSSTSTAGCAWTRSSASPSTPPAQLGEWLTINEIRALEDMNPLPDGDEPLHSVQWQENAPEPEPEPEPELVPVPVAPPEEVQE